MEPEVQVLAYYLAFYVWWLSGVRLQITEGRRSADRQAALFAQGRTVPGRVITRTLNSRHLSGEAFDIDVEGVSPDSVPMAWWEWFALVGEAIGLRWGGRWTLRDFRHFET